MWNNHLRQTNDEIFHFAKFSKPSCINGVNFDHFVTATVNGVPVDPSHLSYSYSHNGLIKIGTPVDSKTVEYCLIYDAVFPSNSRYLPASA